MLKGLIIRIGCIFYGPSVTLCSRISRQTPYKGTVAAVVDGVAVIDFGFAARSEMNQCRNAEAWKMLKGPEKGH